jgi:hypothetical protein
LTKFGIAIRVGGGCRLQDPFGSIKRVTGRPFEPPLENPWIAIDKSEEFVVAEFASRRYARSHLRKKMSLIVVP